MPIKDWRYDHWNNITSRNLDPSIVLDANGIDIGEVFWCNTETGEAGRYMRSQEGSLIIAPDGFTKMMIWTKHPAPLKVVPLKDDEEVQPLIAKKLLFNKGNGRIVTPKLNFSEWIIADKPQSVVPYGEPAHPNEKSDSCSPLFGLPMKIKSTKIPSADKQDTYESPTIVEGPK